MKHPSRRRFLAASGVVAATPLAASVPSVTDSPPSTGRPIPLAPEPPLPFGVCRQLGSARFRDIDFKSTDFRFSADSRWVVGYDGKRCLGYEVATGARLEFLTPVETGWTLTHWLATTDGRLTAVVEKGDDVRLRRYDLPTGRPLPPVDVHGGTVPSVATDGRTLVIESQAGCWGVDVYSGQTVWACVPEARLVPFDTARRLTAAGLVLGEDAGEYAMKLMDVRTGRLVPLQPPGDGRHEVHLGWCSADGTRAVAHLIPQKGEKRWACAWNTATGKKVAAFEVEENDRILGPTADGKGVFMADGKAAELVVRALDGGKVTRRYGITDVAPARSAVSPDGKTLLLGYPDNPVVRVIDAATGRPLPQSPDPPGPLVRVFFPSRTVVAAAFRTAAKHHDYTLYHLGSGSGKRVIDPRAKNIPADERYSLDPVAAVHPDGRIIELGEVRLSVYDPATKTTCVAKGVPTAQRRFWLEGGIVGMTRSDELRTWNPTTGKSHALPLTWPKATEVTLHNCRPSADGRTVIVLAYCQDGRQLRSVMGRLDMTTGGFTTTELKEGGWGQPPAVSADGSRVVVRTDASHEPEELVEFDAEGGLVSPHFVAHDRDGRKGMLLITHATGPFDLSACGRTLVTQSARPTPDDNPGPPALEWWEVATGRLRASFPLTKALADLRCSPCGRFVGTVRSDTPLYLWDIYGETSDLKPLPPVREHAALWDELAAVDAARGFAAVRTLVQHPATAAEVLKAKLPPAVRPKAEWVAARIARLSDRDYHARVKAEKELAAAGDVLADDLKAAAEQGADTEEADDRLMRLVQKADRPADWLRQTRAVEVLEYAGGDGKKLLKALAGGAAGAWLTREAAAAVGRLA